MIVGRITYITTLASTPKQSPLTVADVFALGDVFSETLTSGEMQDIYLYWGTSHKTRTTKTSAMSHDLRRAWWTS